MSQKMSFDLFGFDRTTERLADTIEITGRITLDELGKIFSQPAPEMMLGYYSIDSMIRAELMMRMSDLKLRNDLDWFFGVSAISPGTRRTLQARKPEPA